jgi:effector-binding domain-containing protein
MLVAFATVAGLAFSVAAVPAAPLAASASKPVPSATRLPPATRMAALMTAQSPAATPSDKPALPAQPGDPFGEDTTLAGKPMVYIKGTGTWDKAFETISASIKKIKAYVDKEGLKADGLPITVFTSTDDTGFEFQAGIPVTEAPKGNGRDDIAIGRSPDGHALKFVHRGSYDDLDNTYEAITNYLDDKKLEAKDMFIEEYVTDPSTADANKLVVNIYVLIKPTQTSPG